MIVTSNVLINGSITGGTDASGSAGMAGGAGGDGVVTGDVSGDGDDGGYGDQRLRRRGGRPLFVDSCQEHDCQRLHPLQSAR